MTVERRIACPVCGGRKLSAGPTVDAVPAHAVRLASTVADARAEPRGTIALERCNDCGLVFNTAFDESLLSYGTDYESTQSHSASFRAYTDELVRDLLAQAPHDGAIVDVGCGQGEFLAAFAAETSRRLVGFDPALDPARCARSRASLRSSRFDPDAVDGDVSLITCKMTLEHVPQPVTLLRDIAVLAARSDAHVFVQVPNCAHVFSRVLVSDVIYEHVNYFTAASVGAACRHAGLEVLATAITYADQHLGVMAIPDRGTGRVDTPPEDGGAFARFGAELGDKVSHLRHTVEGLVDEGRTVALWGAGSKAVALLALTGLESAIPIAVDINPLKHGTFLPGSGIEIIAPGDDRMRDATDVFAMNPIYADEIRTTMDELGITARLHLID